MPDPDPGQPGPSRQSDASGPDDEQLLATVGEGELVQMVPCTLLDGAELVELHNAGGDGASGGPYIALDASLASSATGAAGGASGLYYYASYGGEIDAFDPNTAGAAVMYAPDGGRKAFLEGQANSDVNAPSAGTMEAGARAESPEEKKTPKEKTIARVVMAVACTLLTLCIILVGVTLSMSEHINSMVRQIHGGTKTDGSGQFYTAGKNSTTSRHPISDSSR